MAALNPPVTVTELLQLTHLGIPLEHITWPRVSMASDNCICIRHSRKGRTGKEKNSVVTVLNPYRGDFPQTWQTSAGSVKMNPWKPLIALKAGPLFQVYDLESRQLYRKHRVTYPVIFWTWVNTEVIGMVTDAAVFHWDLSNSESPTKIFYRHPRLVGAEIVAYVVDDSLRWHALVGLIAEEERICGVTQLHSSEQNLSQPFEAHAVGFVQYKFQGNQHSSTIMVVAVRGDGNTGKMHIVELGPYLEGNQSPVSLTESITFEDQWEKYDFPVSVQVSTKFGLLYVMTKHGHVHICDLETGVNLCSTTVSADIVFTAVLNSETHGIIAISRNGQVLSVDLKKDHLAQYTREIVKRPRVADRLHKVMVGNKANYNANS